MLPHDHMSLASRQRPNRDPGEGRDPFFRFRIARERASSSDWPDDGRSLAVRWIPAFAAMPGVLAVLTGANLKRRGLGTLRPLVPRRRGNGGPAFVCPQPLLAQDYVRYVGDPVAFVVAETLAHAKDAAELIEIEYEPLPAAITADAAPAPRAPAVWADNPGNEAFFYEAGNKAAVEAALARAPRVVR